VPLAGFLAALWLLGLFAAAPALRTGLRYDGVDRLRDTLILGIAIPFALGFGHLLYPAACWCLLAIGIAVAYLRQFTGSSARKTPSSIPYVLIAALAAVAWPQLMRPLLDGDSLSYHLPNAASWVQAHSLWTTATRYWWYPPASELFAAGLYAVGGPFALPWCGLAALALLGFRIAAWTRDAYAAPALFADALAAATVTIYPLAIQGGTLQNDVWLAAFFVESLASLRARSRGTAARRALAVTALIKPQGWILALIALAASKAGRRLWLTTIAALAVWIVRNGILATRAAIGPWSTASAGIAGSTIAAHGLSALALLVHVGLVQSPFGLLALLAALVGPAIARRERTLGWAACASALLFFILPFGYATSVAQLATGASLRFAAPAMAAGALVVAPFARRLSLVSTVVFLVSTMYGVWYVLAIFWNDGGTHVAIGFAVLAAAVAFIAQTRRLSWANAVAFGAAVIAAVHLAGRHPLDYYADSLRVGPTSPGVYRWIAAAQPPAIGGWGLRLGVVNVVAPSTRTVDLPDRDACAQAHHSGVLLAAVAQSDLDAGANAARLRAARDCGTTLYADATGVVTQPFRTVP
jgi:hypothetical protein